MSEQDTGSTLQLAQELVNHLPKELEEMNDELQKLVLRAEDGGDPMVEIEIIDLLSSHEVTRRLMREQIDLQRDITLGDNAPNWGGAILAGKQGWIPPRQKWFCPNNPCDRWTLVIQEGEEPPVCEEHRAEMVRDRKEKSKKKG
jgi:hypothetical protein